MKDRFVPVDTIAEIQQLQHPQPDGNRQVCVMCLRQLRVFVVSTCRFRQDRAEQAAMQTTRLATMCFHVLVECCCRHVMDELGLHELYEVIGFLT